MKRKKLGEAVELGILAFLALLDAATLPLRALELARRRARAWREDL